MSETQHFKEEVPIEAGPVGAMETVSKQDHGESERLNDSREFMDEIPQLFLVDPEGFLPLNSDRLIAATNVIEDTTQTVDLLIQEEVSRIQILQKKINFWEERIERHKSIIGSNQNKIKENVFNICGDKKNRDYWLGRAENVLLDYAHASSSNRVEDWAWLIKKYGLKNADGSEIDPENSAIDELANGEANNLAGSYKNAGNRYEEAKLEKERESNSLIKENSRMKRSNEQLHTYILETYANEVEPLQDGVLLLKEFKVKLKALEKETHPTYGHMRSWAEVFLDEFIKTNSRISQHIVTEFRKLASIPLPAENC